MKENNVEDAINELTEVIDLAPEDPIGYFNRGIGYLAQEKDGLALKDLDKAVKLAPPLLKRMVLVVLNINGKDPDRGQRLLKWIFLMDPKGALGPFAEGLVAFQEKQFEEGEQLMKAALERDSEFIPAKMTLGRLYAAQKKWKESLKIYESADASLPDRDVRGLIGIGNVYTAMNDYEKMIVVYEKVLAVQPKTVVALNNLAWAYGKLGQNIEKALRLAKSASALAPANASVLDTLAQIQMMNQLEADAIATLEEAKSLDLTSPDVRIHLVEAYLKNKEKMKAQKEWEDAIEHIPDLPKRPEYEKISQELL